MPEQVLNNETKPTEKPFPWRCPKCRQLTVTRVTMPYRCQRTHNGRIVTVEIPNFVVPRCSNCGEVVFDYTADEQIRAALRTQSSPVENGRPSSMPKLLAEDGCQRQHRLRLRRLLQSTDGPVRIASAYVTDREFLIGGGALDVRLITSLSPMDIASGATSLETLRALIESGVKCRFLPDRPRLHAKVYVFGAKSAVVTSANLTESGLDLNIEVGVEVGDENVQGLIEWYDRLWAIARPLRKTQLSELKRKAVLLRRDYVKLKKKSIQRLMLSTGRSATVTVRDELLDLFKNANRFFVCNTDRRHGKRTATGGYLLEEEMHDRGYAAAWWSFRFPDDMKEVQPGDAIFMFAKRVGIIAIGRAASPFEILEPGNPNRIDLGEYREDEEWRVPVHWMDWRDEVDAYRWTAGNWTFRNVSDDVDLRGRVRQHFLFE